METCEKSDALSFTILIQKLDQISRWRSESNYWNWLSFRRMLLLHSIVFHRFSLIRFLFCLRMKLSIITLSKQICETSQNSIWCQLQFSTFLNWSQNREKEKKVIAFAFCVFHNCTYYTNIPFRSIWFFSLFSLCLKHPIYNLWHALCISLKNIFSSCIRALNLPFEITKSI